MAALRLTGNGAEGGTRTRTDYSTRPSNVRGYQLRHLGKFNYKRTIYSLVQRSYLP